MFRTLCLLLLGISLLAASADGAAGEPRKYLLLTQVFRVMTDISGETSQTLPCSVPGIAHIIKEKLGDTELHMEGKTLTWNGDQAPSNPLIEAVSAPEVQIFEGSGGAILEVVAVAQYFEKRDDGLFELHHQAQDPGLRFGFNLEADPGREEVLLNHFSFEYTYITSRESIPEVSLEVGKPAMDSVKVEGEWRLRPGEWSCLMTQVPSGGFLYVFLLAIEDIDTAGVPPAEVESGISPEH